MCIFDEGTDTSSLAAYENAKGYVTVRYTKEVYGKAGVFSRVLLNAPQGLMVDHINGNTLDNRRKNLRLATNAQNQANSNARNTNYPKGVRRKRGRPSFEAKIKVNGVDMYLGSFNTILAAESAYKQAANKYQNEFAFHNSRGEQP